MIRPISNRERTDDNIPISKGVWRVPRHIRSSKPIGCLQIPLTRLDILWALNILNAINTDRFHGFDLFPRVDPSPSLSVVSSPLPTTKCREKLLRRAFVVDQHILTLQQ